MPVIIFGGTELTIQFTDRYFRIASAIILYQIQFFICVGRGVFRVRSVGIFKQDSFGTIELFVLKYEGGVMRYLQQKKAPDAGTTEFDGIIFSEISCGKYRCEYVIVFMTVKYSFSMGFWFVN